jgi:hypothetical protein
VFVIDRVELAMVDEVLHVRELQHRDAVVFEEPPDAGHEVVLVGDVREHVVADDDVGLDAVGDEFVGVFEAEEALLRGYANLARRSRGTRRRIDTEDRNTLFHEVAEQVPVVAGDLDDQRLGIEIPARDEGLDVLAGVPEEFIREGREVRVVRAEEHVGGNGLEDLDEAAFETERERQWVPVLGCVCLVEQGVGEGDGTEGKNGDEVLRTA